jgi:hypothetical protein
VSRQNAQRFWSGGFASVIVLFLSVSLSAGVAGCSGGDDEGATGPAPNPCADASFSSQAEIGFAMNCSTINSNISGITYDQFSRVTAYNYDISCVGGANRKTGRVYNITYNNIGQPLTWDYTVNGTTCRKS